METSSNKRRTVLALEALKKDPKLSIRTAAKIYNIPRSTLSYRRDGRTSRCEISANSRSLTDLEEYVILQRILDLYTRGFQPRQSYIREMADSLRMNRDASRVGPRWAENFVKRHPELRMAFRRRIDYQRAKCEDPNIVRGWVKLVGNVVTKYGIRDEDIYNFDEGPLILGLQRHLRLLTILLSNLRLLKTRLKSIRIVLLRICTI